MLRLGSRISRVVDTGNQRALQDTTATDQACCCGVRSRGSRAASEWWAVAKACMECAVPAMLPNTPMATTRVAPREKTAKGEKEIKSLYCICPTQTPLLVYSCALRNPRRFYNLASRLVSHVSHVSLPRPFSPSLPRPFSPSLQASVYSIVDTMLDISFLSRPSRGTIYGKTYGIHAPVLT